MSLAARWSGVLDDLRAQGRYRSLRLPAGVDFTSNDYLGYGGAKTLPSPGFAGEGLGVRGLLDTSPKRQRGSGSLTLRASANSQQPKTLTPNPSPVKPGEENEYGHLSPSGISSRLLRGHHEIWERVENTLAQWHGAEAALMMNSGYAANEGLLSTIIESGDWVATDEFVHASIIDGLRLSRPRKFLFRHNDLNHLEAGLLGAGKDSQRFVVTESLFSMDGDFAPLTKIVALAERHSAHVIVDEAHTTGCYGPTGTGCVDAAGLRDRVLATVHTGGKALGVMGAYVCGSRLLKEYLVNRCRHLIFTTALPPVVGTWWLEMLGRVKFDEAARRRLHENAAAFRAALAARNVSASGTEYVVPVVLRDDVRAVRAAEFLQRKGFDVRAIRPPSVPACTARLRISVHADHDRETLDRLAAAVAEAVRT